MASTKKADLTPIVADWRLSTNSTNGGMTMRCPQCPEGEGLVKGKTFKIRWLTDGQCGFQCMGCRKMIPVKDLVGVIGHGPSPEAIKKAKKASELIKAQQLGGGSNNIADDAEE